MGRDVLSADDRGRDLPDGGGREWVASTSCLVVVVVAAVVLLVVVPAVLWTAGIACG